MPMVVAGVSADPAGRGRDQQAGQLMRQMGPRRDDDITGQMGGAAAFIRLDQRQSGQNGDPAPTTISARGAIGIAHRFRMGADRRGDRLTARLNAMVKNALPWP
jgi:hypothetical protein